MKTCANHIEPTWQPEGALDRSAFSDEGLGWLLDRGSTTKKLSEVMRIQLLRLSLQPLHSHEGMLLGIQVPHQCWTRETQLFCRDQTWLFARCVFTPALLKGPGRAFLDLGEQSLGSLLFMDSAVERGDYFFATLAAEHRDYQRFLEELAVPVSHFVARRSVFRWFSYPIVLTEYFLPEIVPHGQCAHQ